MDRAPPAIDRLPPGALEAAVAGHPSAVTIVKTDAAIRSFLICLIPSSVRTPSLGRGRLLYPVLGIGS